MTSDHTPADITESLAEGVPHRAIGLVYGTAQEVGPGRIVPVAVVTYGFGGVTQSSRWGTGGGGGGVAVPLGAYVDGTRGPRFQPNIVVLAALAIPLAITVGQVIAHLAKRR